MVIKNNTSTSNNLITHLHERVIIWVLCAIFLLQGAFPTVAQTNNSNRQHSGTTRRHTSALSSEKAGDDKTIIANDSIISPSDYPVLDAEILVPEHKEITVEGDSILNVVTDPNSPYGLDGKIPFNPNPTRAVWLSALFPGLGQIYNRRYWKLPIIVGGFMGLGYATNWNNNQLQDYTQAYRDLTDSDPSTNSYMNFFPPTTSENDLDTAWLTSTMRTRRDYYRRNRDLCIIGMVALYLLCMVDAYVDATLVHFDISDNLSLDVTPTLMASPATQRPGVGLHWAFTF